MKEIVADKELVACCGLYCSACRKYLTDKCPGCRKNDKASWCQVRICCIGNNFLSCADCKKVKNANDCKKFNNVWSKFFAVLFRSDRQACINRIKEKGYGAYACEMAVARQMAIKRKT